MKRIALALACLALSACAHEVATATSPSLCRTPMPLELRLQRIDQRLIAAYAHAPPLSQDEHSEVQHLAACAGVAALGVGDGCGAQWRAAQTSGLAERHRIRTAQFDIPERVREAAAKPLGPARINDLLVAMLTAKEAQNALLTYLHTRLSAAQIATLEEGGFYVDQPPEVSAYLDDPLQMMLVSADLQQAIICDAADLAAGRRTGLSFDPNAPVPAGP